MSYVKVQYPCQDAPFGVESVQQLSDNIDQIKTDMDVRHVPLTVETRSFGGGETFFGNTSPAQVSIRRPGGAHDYELIALGCARVDPPSTLGLITSINNFATDALKGLTKISKGVYYFPIDGYSSVWGFATPYADSTGEFQFPLVEPTYTNGACGLMVTTLQLGAIASPPTTYIPSGSFFGVADYGFTLFAFGSR
jgi:hypothetical protein